MRESSFFSFNEAGGFLPRKPDRRISPGVSPGASMRPEDFSPGNERGDKKRTSSRLVGFNEAGGFLPRKPGGILGGILAGVLLQ